MSSPKKKHHGGETSSNTTDITKPESESKTPETMYPASPRSDGSPISDDTCPICLGNITDKCMANSCRHSFCFVCLKEWSKQKAVCPLCKESFNTIMYEIKSETEFKKWKVPTTERSQVLTNFEAFFVSGRRFFGYRTTNFPGAAVLRTHHGRGAPIIDAIPSGPRERSSAPYRLRGSSFFRLNIYLNNEWVQPIADVTGRYRQSSPELYREQPALTHRLVPWVNRELAALVPSARIGIVLTEIMDLIERYPINSREFRRAVRPHLGSRTNHFVHEFYHFARSPYDMVGHDNAVRYVTRYDVNDADSSESSSEDSDAVVEIDVGGNPVTSAPRREHRHSSAVPNNVEREEVLTQESSVLISSDESSSNEIPQQSNLFASGPATLPTHDGASNPEAAGSATITMTQLLGRARNFLSSINEGASTSVAEGAVAGRSSNKKMKREHPSDSDDSDGCLIIEEVRKRQPTPEIITLESEEEEEFKPASSKGMKHSKKRTCHNSTEDGGGPSHRKKGKKKPCLDRTNFNVSLIHSSADDCSRPLRDHSYCNEQGAEAHSLQGHQPTKSVDTYKDKHRSLIISSDSERDCQVHWRKRIRRKEKHETRKTKSDRRHENTSQDGSGPSSCHDVNSPTRKRRKDHQSKVKNSSHLQNQATLYKRQICDQQVCLSETSSNSWCNSDNLRTLPSSSLTETSSRNSNWQDVSFSDSSTDPRTFESKERDMYDRSKSKHLKKRRKHKRKGKYKEKSKSEKKRKHKKKYKSRRSVSSSSSDSESSYSLDKKVTRHKKKRRRIEDSTTSQTSSDQNQRSKTRRIRCIESSSSD